MHLDGGHDQTRELAPLNLATFVGSNITNVAMVVLPHCMTHRLDRNDVAPQLSLGLLLTPDSYLIGFVRSISHLFLLGEIYFKSSVTPAGLTI